MDRSLRSAIADPRDFPAFAGLLVSLTSLAMPWYRERSCPLFEECGPWRAVSGWESFGSIGLAGLALALALSVAVPGPVLRRALAAACCMALGAILAFRAGLSFVVFGDQEGPLPGFSLFALGLAIAAVAWVAAAAAAPSMQARS